MRRNVLGWPQHRGRGGKGPPEVWLGRRPDLIYGGFPAMLADLARTHPEALDPGDIPTLYRRIGLLVRRGSPRRQAALHRGPRRRSGRWAAIKALPFRRRRQRKSTQPR